MERIPLVDTSCKPQIDYPCQWQYKIIGVERDSLRLAAEECVGETQYTLEEGNVSSSGKYICLYLELIVKSEEHRLRLHGKLAGHDAVKVVL